MQKSTLVVENSLNNNTKHFAETLIQKKHFLKPIFNTDNKIKVINML